MIMISPIIRALAFVLALSSPVMSACINEPDFEWPSSIEDGNPSMKSCTQIRMEPASREAMCPIPEVNVACPLTCGTCCEDDDTYEFQLKSKNKLKGCAWILTNGKKTHSGKNADIKPTKSDKTTEQRIKNYCTDKNDAGKFHNWDGQTVRDACPKSCNFCQVLIPMISWQPMGGDIDGETASDASGTSVSLSSDGNTVAIGATGNDGNGDYSGHTRVFKWDSSDLTWHQMGGDLDGEAAYDFSGYSVSLSSNGNVVAIGAYGNDGGNGYKSGLVRVYTWDSYQSNWHQMGDDLDGEAAYDNSGYSVSLSSDGGTLAIGAYGYDANGKNSGRVRVYRWCSTSLTWHRMGGDLNGEAECDQSGRSVSLSSDGNTVAIGATGNGENGYYSGHVRVYKWDSSTLTWLQMGGDLDGEAAYDFSGGSVSLSSNGNTLAIGAYGNGEAVNDYIGHTRVYRWCSTILTWHQMGDDLDGEAVHDRSGASVSLSSNGNVVAIGAWGNNGNGSCSGHTRVYKWDSYQSNWLPMGDDIDGEAAFDHSGGSVSLSSDGDTVAIGARYNDGNGDTSGHVRVYSVRAV